MRPSSTASTPRIRPTTLDIPGLTKSKESPDGRISQRDVGSKLIIIMVGWHAHCNSYITKKLARYLNWLQHDTKIFNVGERRRLAAHQVDHIPNMNGAQVAANALLNTDQDGVPIPALSLPEPASPQSQIPHSNTSEHVTEESMDQSADFFDPSNKRAAQIREQCAI